jgi:hypothetical protein
LMMQSRVGEGVVQRSGCGARCKVRCRCRCSAVREKGAVQGKGAVKVQCRREGWRG